MHYNLHPLIFLVSPSHVSFMCRLLGVVYPLYDVPFDFV